MGRRRTIQPTQIIQSALVVLTTRGVEAVTISQIAQQAGISEASIYKFFASKEDLLRACLAAGTDPQQFWQAMASDAGRRPLADLLEEAALFQVRYYGRHLHTLVLRVLRPQSAACPTTARHCTELQTLYFQREIDAGRLRLADPSRLALAFIGPLFYQVFASRAFEPTVEPAVLAAEDEQFARTWAQDFRRAYQVVQL